LAGAQILMLSRRQNKIIYSQTDSRDKMWRLCDISGTDSVSTFRGDGMETVPEISGKPYILSWVSGREHFIVFTIILKNSYVSFKTFFFHGATGPSRPGPPQFRGLTITLRHTTFGRTPLDAWWVLRRDLCLTTNNTHKWQPSIPRDKFEPAISAS